MSEWYCEGWECRELEEWVRELFGVDVRIKYCKRVLLRGKDVTKFIRGKYNPETNEIWLTPHTTVETLIHEIAHALYKQKHPEKIEEGKRKREVAISIEKEVEKMTKEILKNETIKETLTKILTKTKQLQP